MHRSKRDEPAAQSLTKRSSSSRARQCSQLSEYLAKEQKTWADWNTSYKRAHAKARIKSQATEGSDKFGAANVFEKVLTTRKLETNNGGDEVGMKDLEKYFDNLTAANINDKSVLEQLVANNAKFVATNEVLVAIVKQLSYDIKNLGRETYHLKKMGGRGESQ